MKGLGAKYEIQEVFDLRLEWLSVRAFHSLPLDVMDLLEPVSRELSLVAVKDFKDVSQKLFLVSAVASHVELETIFGGFQRVKQACQLAQVRILRQQVFDHACQDTAVQKWLDRWVGYNSWYVSPVDGALASSKVSLFGVGKLDDYI